MSKDIPQRVADKYGSQKLRIYDLEGVPYQELSDNGFRVEVTGLTYPDALKLIDALVANDIDARVSTQCIIVSAGYEKIVEVARTLNIGNFSISAKKV